MRSTSDGFGAVPLYQYCSDVIWRLDRDHDGRVAVDEDFLTSRQQWFVRGADRNQDGFADRFEMQQEIAWQIDRNFDRRIDENERHNGWVRFDFPL